jgi:hypothetical protein
VAGGAGIAGWIAGQRAVIARAFLAVLLAVLTPGACIAGWASSAWSDCAWVLWEHVWYTGAKSYLPGYSQTWTPTGAVAKQGDCERGQTSMERQWSALAKLAPPDDPDRSVQWVCLPDTVDPRAPKASGR